MQIDRDLKMKLVEFVGRYANRSTKYTIVNGILELLPSQVVLSEPERIAFKHVLLAAQNSEDCQPGFYNLAHRTFSRLFCAAVEPTPSSAPPKLWRQYRYDCIGADNTIQAYAGPENDIRHFFPDARSVTGFTKVKCLTFESQTVPDDLPEYIHDITERTAVVIHNQILHLLGNHGGTLIREELAALARMAGAK